MTSETLAINIRNTRKPIGDGGNNKSSFFSYPDVLRVRGSVLLSILPQVSFMMLFAALNVYLFKRYERGIALPNTISNKNI
jgi:putative membrane protein